MIVPLQDKLFCMAVLQGFQGNQTPDLFRFRNFELIEVQVGQNGVAPGAGTKIPFQDQKQLQSYLGGQTVYVKKLELYSDQALAFSPLTTTNVNATATNIINATVTLRVKGRLRFDNIPLARLNEIWADTANFVPYTNADFLLEDVFEVDWTQSYVTLLATPGAVPFSFVFGVAYSELPN
jgi:hypothetical protein